MARWVRNLVAAAIVPVVATGCIGAIDRADFNEEVRARGGGIATTWVDESLAAAATALAVDDPADLAFLTLSISGTTRTVNIVARRGDRPDFVDSVTVNEGDVTSVAPIRDADRLSLEANTIRLTEVPIDQLEDLVDAALEGFGEPGAFVTSIDVTSTNGTPTITLQLESPRRTGSAVFDGDGNLLEVAR